MNLILTSFTYMRVVIKYYCRSNMAWNFYILWKMWGLNEMFDSLSFPRGLIHPDLWPTYQSSHIVGRAWNHLVYHKMQTTYLINVNVADEARLRQMCAVTLVISYGSVVVYPVTVVDLPLCHCGKNLLVWIFQWNFVDKVWDYWLYPLQQTDSKHSVCVTVIGMYLTRVSVLWRLWWLNK